VDLNNYLSGTLVQESCTFVRENQNKVVELFGKRAESPLFRERLEQLARFSGPLDKLLDLIETEYRPFSDAANLPIADGCIDYHISYAVFEHIPVDQLFSILLEARRLLKPDGLLIHTIDPSDHFSHDDTSITAINFLQFNEREWHRLTANKFSYHNRLRYSQYAALFERAGVKLLHEEKRIDEKSLASLRNGFPLADDFSQHPYEELSITSVNIMGRFGD
jgi:SAM-dependent methyltransferase